MKKFLLGAVASVMLSSVAVAQEIGSVDTAWSLFGNHKIVIEAFDDPKVPGVSCFLSRAVTGGASGALGIATDTADASIACRQTGPIDTASYAGLEPGEDVFAVSTSPLFKTMKVARFFDKSRNTIIYLTYSTYLVDGSPKNSTSAVTVMPW
jgi:CreA protein